jgi:hypothetical protein
VLLVPVGVAELDAGQRGTTAGIVNDLLHDTADVSMTLGIVEGTEVGGGNTGACDGLEDATLTLTLVSNLEKRRRTISLSLPSAYKCRAERSLCAFRKVSSMLLPCRSWFSVLMIREHFRI